MAEEESLLYRPFGPTIFKVKIPEKIIQELNNYIDALIEDKERLKKLDHGARLAGQVSQEFSLEKEFMIKIGWGKFLAESTKQWILNVCAKKNYRI